tara:strand:- start:92 stop:643 length:552 start_codon:yes stop_codon:yes gene_type:complete
MEYFNSDKETDDYVMFNVLEGLEFYSGTERRTMLNVGKGDGSMLWGNTWKGFLKRCKETGEKIYRPKDPKNPSRYLTKIKYENPELEQVFNEYSKKYFDGFQYAQVQMNRNYPCPKHTDRNKGESICVAFGDYTGGLLCIDYGDHIEKIDPRINPVKFDGYKYTHWVEPVLSGTRYSLVFFTN